jgi:hypothetical protein
MIRFPVRATEIPPLIVPTKDWLDQDQELIINHQRCQLLRLKI